MMADVDLKEVIDGAVAEVGNEEGSQVEGSEGESSTSETEESQAEEQELLKEEDYKTAVDDIKSQKNIHPRFREVYKKWKESTKLTEDLQTQLDDATTSPNISDAQFAQLAAEKGFTKQQIQQSKTQEEQDALESIYNSIEQSSSRQWMEKYSKALLEKATEAASKKYDPQMGEVQKMLAEYRLERSEQAARKLIDDVNDKHKLSIDFDKDVDPALLKLLRSNRNIDRSKTDVYQLTKEYLAQEGIALGKQLSNQEMQKLNEQKKKAASETAGGVTTPSKDYSNQTVAEIMKDVEREQGIMQ